MFLYSIKYKVNELQSESNFLLLQDSVLFKELLCLQNFIIDFIVYYNIYHIINVCFYNTI